MNEKYIEHYKKAVLLLADIYYLYILQIIIYWIYVLFSIG